MSLDISEGYKEAQDRIQATKTYKELKDNYDNLKKRAGDSFENKKEQITQTLDQIKENKKSFERKVKSQFDHLLDTFTITNGSGKKSIQLIKILFLRTLKKIEPEILRILTEESINAVGCDAQQTYSAQTVYIKVSATDLGELLKEDPNSPVGIALYEKRPIQVQSFPFSMNKELYHRIQMNNSFFNEYGNFYLGASGQPLFDIQFVQFDNFGVTGPWWKVTLQNRIGPNKVASFIADYYKSIKMVEFHNIMTCIVNAILGSIKITTPSIGQVEEQTKFESIITRILGLCPDNAKEIDVSGISKLDAVDGIDDAFFEFTQLDLREIEQKVQNTINGVIEFEDCNNIKLPINKDAILNNLNNLVRLDGESQIAAASEVLYPLFNDPNLGLGLVGELKIEADFNIVRKIIQGLSSAIFGPKIILPILVMLKSLGQNLVDNYTTFIQFMKQFKKYVLNVIQKIYAIFIKELYEQIKKDIFNLIQSVISDLSKERSNTYVIMIMKLVQLLIVVAEAIQDYLRCKSLVDDILRLLTIATSGFSIPLPLLAASKFASGYSPTRAFIETIQELQKAGIPTGALEDGSPNLFVLSKFSQMVAQHKENVLNGKTEVFIPPITMTPAGVTLISGGPGKSF